MNASPAVTEFGPWLGVVASPRPRPAPGAVELDQVRLALVSRLLEESRATPPDWLGAWRVAVEAVTDLTLAMVERQATAAAIASRAPDRVRGEAIPDRDDVRVITARLASAGIPLERAVVQAAGAARPEQGFSQVGGAIEESWLAIEAMVADVIAEWAPRWAAVAGWRRPVTGLWVATGVVGVLALLAGLAIGGYLRAPGWFQPVVNWWWSLPWP